MATRNTIAVQIDAETASAHAKVKQLDSQLRALKTAGGIGGAGTGLVNMLGNLGGGTGSLKSMTGLLGLVPGLFGAIGTAGKLAFGAVSTVVRGAASLISGAFSLAVTGAKVLLGGLAAATAATFAAVYAGMKALAPAAAKEMSLAQWDVLLGGMDKAKARFQELETFNLATSFQTEEIDAASRQMQVFGFYSLRNLTAIGDAASAMHRNIVDAVSPLARLRQGSFQQEMMAPLGLSRDILAREGVKFGKQGNMITPGPEAFDAVIAMWERTMGGMAAKMALTWEGVLSNIKDAWTRLWQYAGEGPLTRIKPALTEVFTIINAMADRFKGFDLPWLDKLTVGLKVAGKLMEDLSDAGKRGRAMELGTAAVKATPGYLFGTKNAATGEREGGMVQALAAGLGAGLNKLLLGLPVVFGVLGNILAGAWRFGVALFAEVWHGLSMELRDKLVAAINPAERLRQQRDFGIVLADEVQLAARGFPERRKAADEYGESLAFDLKWFDVNPLQHIRGKKSTGLKKAGFNVPGIMEAANQRWATQRGYSTGAGTYGLGTAKAEEVRMQAEQGKAAGPLLEIAKSVGTAVWDAYTAKAPNAPAEYSALATFADLGGRTKVATREASDEKYWKDFNARNDAARAATKPQRSAAGDSSAAVSKELGAFFGPLDDIMFGPLKKSNAALGMEVSANTAEARSNTNAIGGLVGAMQAAAVAGAKSIGMPPDFAAQMGRTPGQRAKKERDQRQDADIKEKMGRLEAGKAVSFTTPEKRRIKELTGKDVPKPDWQIEQERVRPSPTHKPGMPDRPDPRPVNLGLMRHMDQSRIDMREDNPGGRKVAGGFETMLADFRKMTINVNSIMQALDRMSRMQAIG